MEASADEEQTDLIRTGRPGQPNPCTTPFVIWLAVAVCSVAAALRSKQPEWALLAVPALGWMTLLAASMFRGFPWYSPGQTRRFDRILIEVGGRDAFTVAARDQLDVPIMLQRAERPRLFAAIDFLEAIDDEVLRGVAALHIAMLNDSGWDRRANVIRAVRLLVGLVLTAAAAFIAPNDARVFAVVAAVGLSMWIAGVALALRSRSPRFAVGVFEASDRGAVDLLDDPALVGAALTAMHSWRAHHRATRPAVLRLAQRIITPVRPSWHEAERAKRLAAGPRQQ